MSYSYLIAYSTSSSGPWTQAGTSSVASFTINGLSVGTNYWVRVIAVDTITGLQSSPSVAGPFQTGSVSQESNSGTSVTSSSQTIFSSQTPGQAAPAGGPFDTWTITAQGGQVVHNGVTDTTTAGVLQLFYTNHTVYQEESTGNSFGTPGWWQWTGTTNYPSATPGIGSFTDTRGNVWSLAANGNPVVNGFTDTVSHAQIIYLIGSTVWQEDAGGNWYSLTPAGTITSGSLAWSAPTTTSPVTGWVACASPSGVPLTITGISLSNNTVSSAAPSGTTVGAITVTLSSGAFAGSLAVSGANASSFSVSGNNLITSAGSLAAGNYSINLTATQSSATNSPVVSPFSIISQASTGGPGPAAFSAFITADFSSPYFYPTPGTTTQNSARGQMLISPRLYGVVDGAFANDGSIIGSFTDTTNGNPFALLTSPTYQARMATVNPGLWAEVTPPTASIWNTPFPAPPSVPTLRANAFTNLINNFYKLDPLGVSGIILNINWQRDANIPANQTIYGQMMHVLALFFQNQVMPNTKRCPVVGFCGQNEPDTGQDVNGYYNQIVANVKNVALPGGGTYLVAGPVSDFAGNIPGGWAGFTQNVANVDIFTWDNFFEGGGWPAGGTSMATLQTTRADYFAGGLRSAATQVAYQPGAYAPAGNMDSAVTDPAQADYRGAMWDAIQKITSANGSPVPAYWQKWDSALQNNAGFLVDDGTNRISPAGYANGKQIRTITGTRWNVPTNAAGLLTMACVPSAGHLGLMMVNTGQGAQNNKTVALSHWPVNASGNATANVWQMTSASTADGASSTIPINAGVTSALNFPDPSITIISI